MSYLAVLSNRSPCHRGDCVGYRLARKNEPLAQFRPGRPVDIPDTNYTYRNDWRMSSITRRKHVYVAIMFATVDL
jgi:hypothetical protein